MVSYFSQEIAEHARNGVINKVSGVKLLQGDLAEAWRENNDEYATVAMRFSLIDVMQDRATGRVVSGNPAMPDQATEVWTFVRPVGSGQLGWKLSAIQQAASPFFSRANIPGGATFICAPAFSTAALRIPPDNGARTPMGKRNRNRKRSR